MISLKPPRLIEPSPNSGSSFVLYNMRYERRFAPIALFRDITQSWWVYLDRASHQAGYFPQKYSSEIAGSCAFNSNTAGWNVEVACPFNYPASRNEENNKNWHAAGCTVAIAAMRKVAQLSRCARSLRAKLSSPAGRKRRGAGAA